MGSKTNCQGLIASGLRMIIFSSLTRDLMQSGINLSSDQSPPPMTLPARAELTDILFKKTHLN